MAHAAGRERGAPHPRATCGNSHSDVPLSFAANFPDTYANLKSEDHDLQDLVEETLDQEVSVGSAIGEMVRDAHIDQRTDAEVSGLMIEEEEDEDEEDEEDEEDDEDEDAGSWSKLKS